jgi:hypothetical protein
MRAFLFVLVLFMCPELSVFAGWKQATKKKDPSCQFSFFLNMKVLRQLDAKHVEVSQDSIGFSGIGIVETTGSADPDALPIFGKGFLDIGVRKVKTENGRDFWKECEIK